ncbi:SAM-dependent DNA methyltransferase [Gordonia sp. VNQ95]|uniref:Eco57I restriction-modification methylase domain-containing protein n=1 Tax=Gordonia sp. VNQ95 TaxID=3156619 RepID=UPI0032B562F3
MELLIQAFSEERLKARRDGTADPLPTNPDEVYQAAVTVMMRIVFLLFAEEREMLPTERLYWDSYAIKDLLTDLRAAATDGEELLDETYDVWHRLLAVSDALYGGVNYDEMRMPAYGGSLLDPNRFPWMHAVDKRGLALKVSDRVMMHVLESVQTVVTGDERRRISFRDIDVEQIGYIYEGLLGYSSADVEDDVVLGLVGKDGEEPEIPLGVLERIRDANTGDPRKMAAAIREWVKENQPAATSKTAAALAKLIATPPTADERAELMRLLTPVAGGDTQLLESLISWGKVIRRDLRNIPMVFPRGGLVVVETPSRKNAGAHYTPRSLAEEVVLHALEPLVYAPGPLQTNNDKEWKLKSSAEILDLKVADIAAGSGAFLVAAARYLGERVVEAWTEERILTDSEFAPADDIERRAVREVISRCLYGADINQLAVEMCKLSLWLVSMDKTQPFSFVDDKVFCGNSLLGVTDLDQLRYFHLYPEPTRMHEQLFVDIDAKIRTATRLRHELASPVEEHDPMRSSRAKQRLLEQSRQVTDDLRLIADGVVAAGLPLGGKPGRQLDDAYRTLSWQVQAAFPTGGSDPDQSPLRGRIDSGLTPTIKTDYDRWKPLHWSIEVPDVLIEGGGFDAIVGNPPFLSGKKISTAYGAGFEAWCKSDLDGRKGAADICAHFIRRAWALVGIESGVIGLIASDRVGQGDTAAMSTEVLVDSGTIFRAISEFKWPGKASTSAAIVWASKAPLKEDAHPTLNGVTINTIDGCLSDGQKADVRTAHKLRLSFMAGSGVYLYGEGFLIGTNDKIISELSGNERSFLRPFVNGKSLLGGTPSGKLAIDVNCFQTEADLFAAAPHLAKRLRETVKPVRDSITSQVHESRYWAHWDKREPLFAAANECGSFLVVAENSRVPVFLRTTDTRALYSHKVVIVATDSLAHFGVLNSGVHFSWFERTTTGRGATSTYVVTRCLRTFVFPTEGERSIEVSASRLSGAVLGELEKSPSVTHLYNRIDNPGDIAPGLQEIREAQIALDKAVIESYGWGDLDLCYGHYRYRGRTRWMPADSVRGSIVERLLELNHVRASEERNLEVLSGQDLGIS